MPSINKTELLGLHDWVGNERPLRDDFVKDNRASDSGALQLSQCDMSQIASLMNGTYSAVKDADTGAWSETVNKADDTVFCAKTSTPTATGWTITINAPSYGIDKTLTYTKDTTGNWTMTATEVTP